MKVSFILLMVFTISACNDNESNKNQAEKRPQDQPETKQVSTDKSTPVEKDQGFDFSYKDLDDKTVKLSDYRGKWVVVNFWATWCPPCRKEIPDFVRFKSNYSDQVEILGIDNEDADIEIVRAFAEDYKVNYPILIADVYNPTEFDRENTMGLPTTVIFNPQGVQVGKRVGPMHYDDLVEMTGVTPLVTNETSSIE